MTDLKMTTMTLDEMQAARERCESKTDLAMMRQHKLSGIEPDAARLMREAITLRRAGRPAGSGNKKQVAIRFDKDILEAFRATGQVWQARMNEALKDWLKEHAAG